MPRVAITPHRHATRPGPKARCTQAARARTYTPAGGADSSRQPPTHPPRRSHRPPRCALPRARKQTSAYRSPPARRHHTSAPRLPVPRPTPCPPSRSNGHAPLPPASHMHTLPARRQVSPAAGPVSDSPRRSTSAPPRLVHHHPINLSRPAAAPKGHPGRLAGCTPAAHATVALPAPPYLARLLQPHVAGSVCKMIHSPPPWRPPAPSTTLAGEGRLRSAPSADAAPAWRGQVVCRSHLLAGR